MSDNRIVCSCQEIDYDTIKKAIEDGANTVNDIMEVTGAGTVCGACIGELEEILENLKK